MASLLRKTRNASKNKPRSITDPFEDQPKLTNKKSDYFDDIVNSRTPRNPSQRYNTQNIDEKDEFGLETNDPLLETHYYSSKKSDNFGTFGTPIKYQGGNFMNTQEDVDEADNQNSIDYGRLKLYEARIKEKTENLKNIEEKLPKTIHKFTEFNQIKIGCLQKLSNKMEEKVDDQTIKIEKLILESKVVENKILNLIRAKKEKYEVVGLIQRKKNIQDLIDRLDAQRFKSELLKFSLEDFISFGELCEDYEEFNQLCETFLQDHKIFLDKSDSVAINLSLIYDYLLDQIKEEEVYEEIQDLSAVLEKRLVDQQYINYIILANKLRESPPL